ncbi:MAG: ABC transporter ATP-binding protein/permease [Pseudonocardia sp.]|nr:ABC transporter ATP-binding protein/permease [Pseudonocardia sp.]
MDDSAPKTPLIGVDDLETPYWAEGYEQVANAKIRTVARRAPQVAGTLVRWAWRSSRRLTVLSGVVRLVSGVVSAFGLLATASVFTDLLAEGPTPERVVAALPSIAVVVAALVGRGLLDAASGAAEAALVPLVERQAQVELYAALIELELVAFDDADLTQLIDRATQQTPMKIRQGVRTTGDLVSSLISVVAAVVTAGVLHPVLAPAVLLAAVPQAWASVRQAQLSFGSFVRMTSRMRRLEVSGELIARRENAAEVRAFTAQDVLLAEHRRIADELTAESVRLGRRRNVVATAGRALSGVGIAVGYVALGLLLYAGGLPLPLAGTAVIAMRTATAAITSTVFSSNQLFEAGFYIDLHQRCLADVRTRSRPAATASLAGDPSTIELRDVGFRYPGQEADALAGIDLTLHRGEVVALVGENGSGKSTLAKLITGLYLPDTGSVTWNGVRTGDVPARELHDRVAVVLQDPVRWPITAENNVRIGRLDRPDPDDVVFADATARSGADAVLAALPAGLATVLSRAFQEGRDLSGGQWQRMSVARGLYRDAPLVVADEPTAAMDARAEHAVFRALQEMSAGNAGRITVLVTHRLANVRHADRIVVLEQGRLVEQGTHDELMAARGTYEELFSLQARAYSGDGRDVRAESRPPVPD